MALSQSRVLKVLYKCYMVDISTEEDETEEKDKARVDELDLTSIVTLCYETYYML